MLSVSCVLFFLAVIAFVPVYRGDKCNFPPRLWCSSLNIARACKVERQCMEREWSEKSDIPLVNLTLYYECLCPDCQEFMQNQLWPVYKAVGNLISLDLLPYGNARQEKDGGRWIFHCQHGSNECTGNIIETCAIHILHNVSRYFPFIYCLEMSPQTAAAPTSSAKKCADQLGVKFDPIEQCASGPLGNQLEHEMAERTNRLNPPHTFVPWVVLNGEHTDEIQREAQSNLLKLICDTYQGPKPSACKTVKISGCPRQWSPKISTNQLN